MELVGIYILRIREPFSQMANVRISGYFLMVAFRSMLIARPVFEREFEFFFIRSVPNIK